jgi:hypothetical protein
MDTQIIHTEYQFVQNIFLAIYFFNVEASNPFSNMKMYFSIKQESCG